LAFVYSKTKQLPGRTPGGTQAGRIGAAEERSVLAGARSALRALTCRTLSERSEHSERSELCGTAKTRAPQGARSEAKGKPSEPRLRPARHFARANAGEFVRRTF
jgi:hypothetical protein